MAIAEVELPITNTDKVRQYLKKLEGPLPPNQLIADELGLNRQQVAGALAEARRCEISFRPTPEDSRRRLREGVILAKGGKRFAIRPFANMGMAPSEIHWALLADTEVDIPSLRINNMLSKARNSQRDDSFRRLEDEERMDVRKSVIHAKEEDIKGRVRLWLGVRDKLFFRGLADTPRSRSEWLYLMELQQGREAPSYDRFLPNTWQRLTSCIETIKGITLRGYLRQVFADRPKDIKVIETHKGVIDQIDHMPEALDQKMRLFRCLFWEESGGGKYAEMFGIEQGKLWQHLKDLIGDDMDDLRQRFDAQSMPGLSEKKFTNYEA